MVKIDKDCVRLSLLSHIIISEKLFYVDVYQHVIFTLSFSDVDEIFQ